MVLASFLLKQLLISSAFHFMNVITRAILINSRSGNEVLSIRKVHPRCLTYVEKISNVSRYEFTSIAVYKLVGLYSLSANLS